MPLSIPTRKALVQSGQAYFQTNVPEWDPTTARRSYAGGLVKGTMSALHDWYVALRQAALMFFPQTAQGLFLTQGWWADITKLSLNPATASSGRVVLTGTAGTAIPKDTVLTANGLSFTADNSASIVSQSLNIVTLTATGGVATATTASAHMLATGQTITMSGAVQAEYNVAAAIVVTSETGFTYAITGSPASPATGAPKLTAVFASVAITCTTKGRDTNIDGGATLVVAPLTNVSTTARVTFGGISGGTDVESQESLRARFLFALGTDFGMFTGDEIKIIAQQVPGVTRVWVRKASVSPAAGWPLEGQVFVAFMRDNDVNPFPTGSQVSTVYTALATTVLPAHTAPEDLVVSAPVPQPVNFTFTAVSPDTSTMRAAVKASLVQFFGEAVDYGVDIPIDDYRCAIRDTYDSQGRTRLKSFTLSSPAAAVTVAYANLPTLGTITWPS